MKLSYIIKTIPLLLLVIATACTGDYSDEFTKDNLPAVSVTYDGATTAGFNPYYSVPYNGGNGTIAITLKIPATSKVKIKELTKVIAGATSILPGNVKGTDPATTIMASYISAPIASSDGYSVTLNTNLTEFNAYATGSKVSSAPAAGTFTERAFMFLLTMDDDSEVIPMQCRIRVTP